MMAEYLRRRRLSQVYSRNASSSVMTEAEGLRIKSKPRTKQFNSKDPSIIRHFSFEWRENSRSCNTRYLSSPFYKYTLFTTIRFLNSARPQALGRLCSQAWRQPPEEREFSAPQETGAVEGSNWLVLAGLQCTMALRLRRAWLCLSGFIQVASDPSRWTLDRNQSATNPRKPNRSPSEVRCCYVMSYSSCRCSCRAQYHFEMRV